MKWLRTLAGKLIPSQFDDRAVEELFLHGFRSAGLRATSYACGVAIAGYFLIGAIDITFNGWSSAAATRRLLLIALLGGIVCLMLTRPDSLLRRYNLVLGSLVLVAYICSVSVTHLFRNDNASDVVNPTALIGLWIIYGFVRLPLKISLLLGVAGGICALFGSRVTNMPDAFLRTSIYLLLGNALGFILARSVELRERELFQHRRTLEAAQAELQRRSLIAEEAYAEKSRLVAAVGHDLRQPMMAATLHLAVLMHRGRDGDVAGVQRQADRVNESVKLLSDTLEHLLLAARYEAGTVAINVQKIPLSDIFQKLLDLCEPQASASGVALRISVPRSGVLVMTDGHILLRALVNLVTNALKFSKGSNRKGSRVVVRIVLRGAVCRIAVMDNGIGIAQSDLNAIWQPFFQAGNRERNREGGLGLGLYLVRQSLLSLDEHSVCVDSRFGAGTRFVLSVPGFYDSKWSTEASEASTYAEKAMAITEEASRLQGMYVLLVEDDVDARYSLQALLGEWGIIWSSAECIEAALASHAETDRRVDAIIADFRLPGNLNGINSIKHARVILGYSPSAVLISAEVELSLLTTELPEKTVSLQKPFDPSILYGLLCKALDAAVEEEQALSACGLRHEFPSSTTNRPG